MERAVVSPKWPQLLGLKEEEMNTASLGASADLYNAFYSILFSSHPRSIQDILLWNLQPSLSLHLSPYLMSHLYLSHDPTGCVTTLTKWSMGDTGQLKPTNEDDSEHRLFDRGEANTNYEDAQLRLAAYYQLKSLNDALSSCQDK